jgi:pimeloyl-ACP methyl ester carboxylesterase
MALLSKKESMMTETIFMIHGMWGGSWAWQNYKSFFEKQGYHCVATTLRFHDMEPKDTPHPQLGTTSLLDYAQDLEQEIQQLGLNPIVMGHSMGGLLAQILASRGLAKALVLLTPASPAGIIALTPSVIKSFWSVQKTLGFWKKPMRQTFDEAVYSMLHLVPVEEQREAYDKFVYESGRAASEIGYWIIDAKKAAQVDETKVRCPVLVIAGGQDRITPASVVRKVAEKYKAVSTYKEFEDHAHWVLAEPGWLEIAEYIISWLKQI